MKFYLKFRSFHSRKFISKCCLKTGSHFVHAPMRQNNAHTSMTKETWIERLHIPNCWWHLMLTEVTLVGPTIGSDITVLLASNTGAYRNIGYMSEMHLKLKSHAISCIIALLSNHFEILYRARQYHCRALYKFSKWFHNWNGCYRWMRFHEIWVWDEFRMDIFCCNCPQDTAGHVDKHIEKKLFHPVLTNADRPKAN